MFRVAYKLRKWVLYPQRLTARIEKAKKKILNRWGAIVRARSRRLVRIRKRKKSQPGELPFARHRGGIRNVRYATVNNASVIIGPIREGTPNNVPKILAEGGTTVIRRRGKKSVRARIAKRKSPQREALKSSINDLPEVFRNAVI